MPEPGNATKISSKAAEAGQNVGAPVFPAPRLEAFSLPQNHEERLEWVKKSCERFFEKVLEIDALVGLPELN